MIKALFKVALMLAPVSMFAQDNGVKAVSYINPYAGGIYTGAVNTEQNGVAHKRGNYNAFNTDFDLNVRVVGESETSTGYTVGLTYGTIWTKKDRVLNTGIELDVFNTRSSHQSLLINTSDETISNVVGPNADSVADFVKDHYAAGEHRFSNTMVMSSWNAAANLVFAVTLSPRVTFNAGMGLGFSAITLKDAESLQISPANAIPGFETTIDNGGGAVNHFNTRTTASKNLMFGQFRLGTRIAVNPKLAVSIDLRGTYRGDADFTFGSTKYTDHAPTDHWNYTIGRHANMMFTGGLVRSF